MATLNTSTNGPNITRSYQSIVNAPAPTGPKASSPTYAQWAVFTVVAPLVSAFQHDGGKESVLKVQSTGEGELADLIDEFSDGRIQFAFVKIKDPNTTLPKCVLIAWCGEGVPERTKGYFGSHKGVVAKLLHGYHVEVTARSEADLTPERIVQKVADASGAKYAGGPQIPSTGGAPPAPAKKPVFTPTQVGGSGSSFNALGSRSRAPAPDRDVDNDGWGADAPPVTRSQLEKVESAYKPTKVNIAELTKKHEPSRYQAPEPKSSNPDVVKGGYQPIGKVDIAAIRAAAKEQKDDRPTVVKGAYEPVGKVDIAAIRAKAQAAPSPSPSRISPAVTGASDRGNEDEAPKSLADRSAAFTSSERLTSLPKPKVANRFGSTPFTGTKAPTPTGFGAKATPPPPVGAASRTFADQGGKTPAQLWAEKKRAQGGSTLSPNPTGDGASPSPIAAETSGSGGWKSGYTGKSWAPVETNKTGKSATSNISAQRTGEEPEREEEEHTPSGGIGALKDRFASAAPMGAPASRPAPEPTSPPAMDMSSKPNAGARGVPIPGLPSRPAETKDEEDVPAVQHQRMPSPPPQPPRSPSPEPSGSPVRIAMPVSRSAAVTHPEPLSPAEEHAPPMPTRSLEQAAQQARALSPEPKSTAEDPARGAAMAAAAVGVGAAVGAGAAYAAASSSNNDNDSGSGIRAIAQYDYEKAEDNEIELREGEYVTNIDMVDDDWWMGDNARGERGLFPSNYVEVVEENGEGAQQEEAPVAPPLPSHPAAAEEEPAAPAMPERAQAAQQEEQGAGATATALYDYEAAEDNELTFPEGAKITDVSFPDDDWWHGRYNGQEGLFPANYVELDGQ